MHDQVDDRLKFYETGEAPMKNEDAMMEVLEELKSLGDEAVDGSAKKKKKKKKKSKDEEEDDEVMEETKEVCIILSTLEAKKDKTTNLIPLSLFGIIVHTTNT